MNGSGNRRNGEAAARARPGSFFAVRNGRIELWGRQVPLPRNRAGRIAIGVALILCGFLGFLPILGFWMVPLGLLVLSMDLAIVRRMRRRTAVRWGRWRRPRDNAAGASRTAAELVADASAARFSRD